jgi:exopolyphosphatase/guanosine-5'-triphosphate,3'-diphosphate pyrophosphatase
MNCSRLVGMGGTIMVLASILRGDPLFEPERLHGSTLSLEGVRSVVSLMCGLSPSERASVRGLPADRADLALPGAVIVECVMTRLGIPGLLASAWGIRHGRMAELF